jgi:hypothetical protein
MLARDSTAAHWSLPTWDVALWTVGDIRLPGRALNFRGKHATLNSTFWQDAHICGEFRSIK